MGEFYRLLDIDSSSERIDTIFVFLIIILESLVLPLAFFLLS